MGIWGFFTHWGVLNKVLIKILKPCLEIVTENWNLTESKILLQIAASYKLTSKINFIILVFQTKFPIWFKIFKIDIKFPWTHFLKFLQPNLQTSPTQPSYLIPFDIRCFNLIFFRVYFTYWESLSVVQNKTYDVVGFDGNFNDVEVVHETFVFASAKWN